MHTFIPSDLAERTGFSVRSVNALRGAGIHTVADLFAYSREEISRIRNLGAKSVEEIYRFLDSLDEESENFNAPLREAMKKEAIATFYDAGGVLRKDFPLERLGLSNRSMNQLKKAGYTHASQLIGITQDKLFSIKNLGINSVNEIIEAAALLVFQEATDEMSSANENAECKEFVSAISKFLSLHVGKLYEELLPIFDEAKEKDEPVSQNTVFSNTYLRNAVKHEVLEYLSGFAFGIERLQLSIQFPEDMIESAILLEILAEMGSDDQIIAGDKIERKRMTILEYAQSISKEQERIFLQMRLQGNSLEEIGSQHNMTRERVRQVVAKCLNRKPIVAEDKYVETFEEYDLSKNDFFHVFGETESTYNYLSIVCKSRGTSSLEQFLADESASVEARRRAEKIVYKDYARIDGEMLYKSRAEISDYVVRTYFQDEASFDDFITQYNSVLDSLGLSSDEQFAITGRGYEHRFGASEKTLWKQGRRFRYYDIASYDFSDFWQEMALEQYHDVEYSALKFFKDHPELMHQYDIRDEYELHNLLKKLCQENAFPNISFGRMPMIEFGTANRDEQVLDTLLQLAPISIQDFAVAYEAEYGVQVNTFMANYLKNFNEYFHNGIYDISATPLSQSQFAHMTALLTDDYYEMSEVRELYLREFSNESAENINPYTLKTLGYNVYASYVVRSTYPSASDYFRTLLTRDDLVDTREFPSGVTGKVSYSSLLYSLRRQYEIVEYEPLRYINIQRLNNLGIAKEQIVEYCAAVASHINDGDYFTITSLRQSGFAHALDDFEFDDVFYAALLTEDREHFSYQRMGGTKVFRRGIQEVSLASFIESVVEQEIAINVDDLVALLIERYGTSFDRFKIVEVAKGRAMHYDSIMKKFYVDYDAYLAEV